MTRGTFAKGAASAAVVALALTACSGGEETGEGEASTDPITWMTMLHTPTTPEADGVIETALEEYTGEEFEMQWVPDASKEEKINAALASGALADIVSLTVTNSSSVRQAMSSGMFWDVEPYLADYPNLSQIDPQTLESARLDGHLYGVPYQKIKARYGVVIRQDWLDNLGLETPHTIDELTEVAKAFTTQDPDGNGKDDTTGFVDRLESFAVGFRSLAGYFGAGQQFQVLDDGQVVPAFTTDEYKEAMEWYRSVYEAGAVNQEFVTVQKQNQQDAIAQGKGGIVVTGLFEAKNYMALAQNANPDTPMAWALVNDITAGDVERRILTDTNGGMGGWLAFPKSEVKTEADLQRMLAFVDKLIDEDAYALMTNGVEGTHYEMDADGVVTITDTTAWEQQVQPYAASRPSEKVVTYKSSTPYVDEGNEKMAENEDYVVINPAQSLTSETYDRQWSTIEQKVNDAYNQYITGQIEMADYEAVIEEVRGQGLDDIIAEYTAAYAEVNG
ncbi:putative aldouronate transport system substrate-binding protein [Isoptericola jiangsuensis]|uniref:Putative aldouronate transport system substrate-binding protein n=1 Tax=Isoptericola jiangsuensis TaxID=548579 RepID=A0A2A9EZI9_9MICO|nr:extracellular solute-binding protein [Isoptericola jiangsuensis]PFG44288.1 putative aldouronate transport system substrate-binding protein [Isoptericola jiangsuensis]